MSVERVFAAHRSVDLDYAGPKLRHLIQRSEFEIIFEGGQFVGKRISPINRVSGAVEMNRKQRRKGWQTNG